MEFGWHEDTAEEVNVNDAAQWGQGQTFDFLK